MGDGIPNNSKYDCWQTKTVYTHTRVRARINGTDLHTQKNSRDRQTDRRHDALQHRRDDAMRPMSHGAILSDACATLSRDKVAADAATVELHAATLSRKGYMDMDTATSRDDGE